VRELLHQGRFSARGFLLPPSGCLRTHGARNALVRLILTQAGMPAQSAEVASLAGELLQSSELDDIRYGHIIGVLLY
jgi:hypothetical protein